MKILIYKISWVNCFGRQNCFITDKAEKEPAVTESRWSKRLSSDEMPCKLLSIKFKGKLRH